MALETVVYPQDPFFYCPNAFLRPNYAGYPSGLPLAKEEADPQDYNGSPIFANDNSTGPAGSHCAWPDVYRHHHNNIGSSTDTMVTVAPIRSDQEQLSASTAAGGGRRKRRRVKSMKNHEEIENQRMTHIAVERNRRKQMNEYLAVLRSLMPPSYSQRGDQASIIGGAINFVKELEQLLQSMESQKFTNDPNHNYDNENDIIGSHQPFSDFFSFPQYSTGAAAGDAVGADASSNVAADIEVTMVESHANLKIQSRRRPKQLLKLVAGLQAMKLSVLHLNVTSSGNMVLYSVNVKVEEGCHLTTVDEIAAAVNQMLHRIEEESSFS